MKVKNLFKITAISLMLIALPLSCVEPEEPTELPPETQKGANTFGCYVNGELFVSQWAYAPWGGNSLSASYLYSDMYFDNPPILTIEAYGKQAHIILKILNPKENAINIAFMAYSYFNNQNYVGHNIFRECKVLKLDCSLNKNNALVGGNQKVGEIFITKLDFGKKIVSGRFNCYIGEYLGRAIPPGFGEDINTYTLDPILIISEGRFDIKLE